MKNNILIRPLFLCIISLLITHLAIAHPVFAEPGDPVWDQQVKDAIKKSRMEKDEREKERIKAGRAQVDAQLLELEDAYNRGGNEEEKKIANEKELIIKDNIKITVYIRLKPGISVEQFDRITFKTYGGEIFDWSTEGSITEIVADIPIGMIIKISEIKDIADINLPSRVRLESYNSEGVSLTGARSYQITGVGVKVAVIDSGFVGLCSK